MFLFFFFFFFSCFFFFLSFLPSSRRSRPMPVTYGIPRISFRATRAWPTGPQRDDEPTDLFVLGKNGLVAGVSKTGRDLGLIGDRLTLV